MNKVLGGLALSAAALTFSVTEDASAQYLQQAQSGYLPEQSQSTNLSLAGSESGFYQNGPVWSRVGVALDFGAGGLSNGKLDERFYAPNGTMELGGVTAFAWDFTLYGQFRDTFRAGFHVGGMTGGQSDVDASLLNAGLLLEGGKRFYTGWGLWLGTSVGYGRGLASSISGTGSNVRYHDYESIGLGVRAFGRVERELAPFITLRLTPFVDTLVRTDDRYTLNLPEGQSGTIPDRSRGSFVGYGLMLGIAIHSF